MSSFVDSGATCPTPGLLGAAEANGAVAGMDGERHAPAIQLALNVRAADPTLDHDWKRNVHVAVARLRVAIRLEAVRQRHVHAAVARADVPGRRHLGAGIYARVDAAVAGPDIQD